MRRTTKVALLAGADGFDEVGGIVASIALLIVLVVVAIWYFHGQLGAKFAQGISNFAGGISNGLYNLNAPSAISGPVNSSLSALTSWADEFYSPDQYSGAAGDGSAGGIAVGS